MQYKTLTLGATEVSIAQKLPSLGKGRILDAILDANKIILLPRQHDRIVLVDKLFPELIRTLGKLIRAFFKDLSSTQTKFSSTSTFYYLGNACSILIASWMGWDGAKNYLESYNHWYVQDGVGREPACTLPPPPWTHPLVTLHGI